MKYRGFTLIPYSGVEEVDYGMVQDPSGKSIYTGEMPSKDIFQWFQQFVDTACTTRIKGLTFDKLVDAVTRSDVQYTKCKKCKVHLASQLREQCPECGSEDVEWEFQK